MTLDLLASMPVRRIATSRNTVYTDEFPTEAERDGLKASRFLMPKERSLPYRTARGDISLPLLLYSQYQLNTGEVSPADADVVVKLNKWLRMAKHILQESNEHEHPAIVLQCPICYAKYPAPEVAVLLPCEHRFCLECATKQLLVYSEETWAAKCSLCRTEVEHAEIEVDGKSRRIPIFSSTEWDPDTDRLRLPVPSLRAIALSAALCAYCFGSDGFMVICDQCECSFHIDCQTSLYSFDKTAIQSLPEWYCSRCKPEYRPAHSANPALRVLCPGKVGGAQCGAVLIRVSGTTGQPTKMGNPLRCNGEGCHAAALNYGQSREIPWHRWRYSCETCDVDLCLECARHCSCSGGGGDGGRSNRGDGGGGSGGGDGGGAGGGSGGGGGGGGGDGSTGGSGGGDGSTGGGGGGDGSTGGGEGCTDGGRGGKAAGGGSDPRGSGGSGGGCSGGNDSRSGSGNATCSFAASTEHTVATPQRERNAVSHTPQKPSAVEQPPLATGRLPSPYTLLPDIVIPGLRLPDIVNTAARPGPPLPDKMANGKPLPVSCYNPFAAAAPPTFWKGVQVQAEACVCSLLGLAPGSPLLMIKLEDVEADLDLDELMADHRALGYCIHEKRDVLICGLCETHAATTLDTVADERGAVWVLEQAQEMVPIIEASAARASKTFKITDDYTTRFGYSTQVLSNKTTLPSTASI